jgi:hypothetical protein
MKTTTRTPAERFSCMLLVRNFCLWLVYSNDSGSIVKYRHILNMAMHPGFPRAGWQPEIFCITGGMSSFLCMTSGMNWPAVSVSFPSGTAGISVFFAKVI